MRQGLAGLGPAVMLAALLALMQAAAGPAVAAGASPAVPAAVAPSPAVLPATSATITACLEQAAARYALPPLLLHAIAEVESGGNPGAVSPANRDGSRDIGLMQINSGWLPRLAAWRIDEAALLDPCVSAHVGAWILAGNIARLGPVWRAVGAYNARTPSLQLRYALKVRAAMRRLGPATGGAPPARGVRPP